MPVSIQFIPRSFDHPSFPATARGLSVLVVAFKIAKQQSGFTADELHSFADLFGLIFSPSPMRWFGDLGRKYDRENYQFNKRLRSQIEECELMIVLEDSSE